MKKTLAVVSILTTMLLFLLALSLSACDGTASEAAYNDEVLNPEIQAIVDRGALRVGVKNDTPGLGFFNSNTGRYEGLEIDMARLLAKRILGDSELVEFTSVTASTRGTLLDNDQLDMVIATFTIRDERKEFWNFSQYYFIDSVGIMVGRDSGIRAIEDFDGKTIAVTTSSTTQAAIEAYIEQQDYDIDVSFQEFPTNQDCDAALAAGRVDAFSIDKAILAGFMNDEREIMPLSFNPQEYGIATRLDSPYLTQFVDDFITEVKEDGTLKRLISDNGLVE